ncbi:MAG TPA: N-formylglutamate amidohydrolase [Anaerolineaceae bacterium]|jgi:hypothetical protein|nr:N-formylglutamate amidohydrolase [Anaerolineaceae bacterium]
MVAGSGSEICVVIPHAGRLLPPEIHRADLAENAAVLLFDCTDWYTDLIYDFRDWLENPTIQFDYSPLCINLNRHPDQLDFAAPLIFQGQPIYRTGREPSPALRRTWIDRLGTPFFQAIARGPHQFILDAHSTRVGMQDEDGVKITADIIINDCTSNLAGDELRPTAPPGCAEIYATELGRRLPELKIDLNAAYLGTYGYIGDAFGWHEAELDSGRAPLLLQETNELLYMDATGLLLPQANDLRRIFAEALLAAVRKMSLS